MKIKFFSLILILLLSTTAHAFYQCMGGQYDYRFELSLNSLLDNITYGDATDVQKSIANPYISVKENYGESQIATIDFLGCHQASTDDHKNPLLTAVKSQHLSILKMMVEACKTAYQSDQCPLVTSSRDIVLVPKSVHILTPFWTKCDYPKDLDPWLHPKTNDYFWDDQNPCSYFDYSEGGDQVVDSTFYYYLNQNLLNEAIKTKNLTIISYLLDEGAVGINPTYRRGNSIGGKYGLVSYSTTLETVIRTFCTPSTFHGHQYSCFSDPKVESNFRKVVDLILKKNPTALLGYPELNSGESNITTAFLFLINDLKNDFILKLKASRMDLLALKQMMLGDTGIYSLVEASFFQQNLNEAKLLIGLGLPLESTAFNQQGGSEPLQGNVFKSFLMGALYDYQSMGDGTSISTLSNSVVDSFFDIVPTSESLKNSSTSKETLKEAIQNGLFRVAKRLFQYGVRTEGFEQNGMLASEVYTTTGFGDDEWCEIPDNKTLFDLAFQSAQQRKVISMPGFVDRPTLPQCYAYQLGSVDFVLSMFKNGYQALPAEKKEMQNAILKNGPDPDPAFKSLYNQIGQFLK